MLCSVLSLMASLACTCVVLDEGGFAPNISSNKEGLDLVKKAIDNAGYTGKVC